MDEYRDDYYGWDDIWPQGAVWAELQEQAACFPLHYLVLWFSGSTQDRKDLRELLAENPDLDAKDSSGGSVRDYLVGNPEVATFVASYYESVLLNESASPETEKSRNRRI